LISTPQKPTIFRCIRNVVLLSCAILVLPACNWVSLIGVTSSGELANGYTSSPSLSADDRYAAFNSFANNLVSNDTNGAIDVGHTFVG